MKRIEIRLKRTEKSTETESLNSLQGGMPFPVVISFYTKDTFYQLEVQNLIASCAQFGDHMPD